MMMRQTAMVLVSLALLAAYVDKQASAAATSQPDTGIQGQITQTIKDTQGLAVQAGRDAHVTVNYQKSQDYQALLAQRDKLRDRVEKYPDDADFRQELAAAERDIQGFERDILQLAETINSIPLNTKALRLAKQFFDAGDYAKARAALNDTTMQREQDALLKRQRELQAKQAEIQQQLDDNANGFLLKAQLTAIDYSLGDQRITKTSAYFEQALKSGRTPERLFEYAVFLTENNQFKAAEKHYTEALADYRKLAVDNPAVYWPNVADTLTASGHAYLQWGEVDKAIASLKEAEKLFAELAQQTPNIFKGKYDLVKDLLKQAERARGH